MSGFEVAALTLLALVFTVAQFALLLELSKTQAIEI
jgi:hypothetical protein